MLHVSHIHKEVKKEISLNFFFVEIYINLLLSCLSLDKHKLGPKNEISMKFTFLF